MDSGECSKQEDAGDSLFGTGLLPKPFWVRYFGLQTNVVNKRLLEHNAYIICIFGPVLWSIFYFI